MTIKQLKQIIKEEVSKISIAEATSPNLRKMAESAISQFIALHMENGILDKDELLNMVKIAFNKKIRQGISDEEIKTFIQENAMHHTHAVEECDTEISEDVEADREKMIKGIKKGVQTGQIPKTYKDKKTGQTKPTNPFAISNAMYGPKKKQ